MELEQLDLVVALVALRDKLTDIVVKATTDGPDTCPWADIADAMDKAARLCRNEVRLDAR